jgi:hypothetical protein
MWFKAWIFRYQININRGSYDLEYILIQESVYFWISSCKNNKQ